MDGSQIQYWFSSSSLGAELQFIGLFFMSNSLDESVLLELEKQDQSREATNEKVAHAKHQYFY